MPGAGQGQRVGVMAILKPDALALQAVEAVVDVEFVPALQVVAAKLVEDDEDREPNRRLCLVSLGQNRGRE